MSIFLCLTSSASITLPPLRASSFHHPLPSSCLFFSWHRWDLPRGNVEHFVTKTVNWADVGDPSSPKQITDLDIIKELTGNSSSSSSIFLPTLFFPHFFEYSFQTSKLVVARLHNNLRRHAAFNSGVPVRNRRFCSRSSGGD